MDEVGMNAAAIIPPGGQRWSVHRGEIDSEGHRGKKKRRGTATGVWACVDKPYARGGGDVPDERKPSHNEKAGSDDGYETQDEEALSRGAVPCEEREGAVARGEEEDAPTRIRSAVRERHTVVCEDQEGAVARGEEEEDAPTRIRSAVRERHTVVCEDQEGAVARGEEEDMTSRRESTAHGMRGTPSRVTKKRAIRQSEKDGAPTYTKVACTGEKWRQKGAVAQGEEEDMLARESAVRPGEGRERCLTRWRRQGGAFDLRCRRGEQEVQGGTRG
ncbi:hypothetical protein R3P38DRAFT_3356428 [Favolaschia claudopus]|uniref:Uncharacterized protein n=1 Tax=Favolaschia claudopus TaxID=2862362 RepID=A0AAW0BHP9_9AGAR